MFRNLKLTRSLPRTLSFTLVSFCVRVSLKNKVCLIKNSNDEPVLRVIMAGADRKHNYVNKNLAEMLQDSTNRT